MQHFKINKLYSFSFLPAALCALFFALCLPAALDARVKGKCQDCHDMHAEGPLPFLMKGGCLGCHGQAPGGAENIITSGLSRIPQVVHYMQNGDLAAGNFYYVADGYGQDYSKGHNVAGISRKELPPMDKPPGFISSAPVKGGAGPADWTRQNQLTCSGTYGCHGNRAINDQFEAISGAHHSNDTALDGTTVGKSYRFLYGIKGREHPNWEYQATIENHNGYQGYARYGGMDSTSYLCGSCHGDYHPSGFLGNEKGVGSPTTAWKRHPSDLSFGNVHAGYIGSEYQDYITYSLEAPVAYEDPTGRETVVNSQSIIMCMSCHRAHASNYADSMRWDYGGIGEGNSAGKSNGTPRKGCFTCHTKK